jgi:C4-dicarboxylate-specific signal transduction histidine kinase
VQFLLVCFLSVLLDVFGAFFVSLIGEENRFRRRWLWQQAREQAAARQAASAANVPPLVSKPEPEPAVVAQVRSVLESGELKCSKRGVAEALSLSLEEVDRVFQHLLAQGVLGQGSNRHYHLSAQAG